MNFKLGALLLLLVFSISCEDDYVNNSRIFVEGKITSPSQSVNQIPLKIISSRYPISQGTTQNDGSFKLGGPDTADQKTLFVGKKIIRFSADAPDCFLDFDSLSIILPENMDHVKFSNITIE